MIKMKSVAGVLAFGLVGPLAVAQTLTADKPFEDIVNAGITGLTTEAQVRLGNIAHIAAAACQAPEGLTAEQKAIRAKDPVAFLAGRIYSRTFMGRPLGSSASVELKHSVEFNKNGTFLDNANTFFGSPPMMYIYQVVDDKIVFDSAAGEKGTYVLSADATTLSNGAGAVLTLEKR